MPSPVFLPLLLHLRDLGDALTSGFCQFADKNQYRRILGRTSSFFSTCRIEIPGGRR